MRRAVGAGCLLVLAVACGPSPGTDLSEGEPPPQDGSPSDPDPPSTAESPPAEADDPNDPDEELVPPADQEVTRPEVVHPDAIWFEVLERSAVDAEIGAMDLATTPDELAVAWDDAGLDGDPPAVDLDSHVVVVYVKPENACPDDLAEVLLTDDVLGLTFVATVPMCAQPLIPTVQVVALHRADLPTELDVHIPQHPGHGGDVDATFTLDPYEGPPAPEPTAPTRQPGDEDVAALIGDHPLPACTDVPAFTTEPEVDGPVSADPDVAAAQHQRAELGLASDEATVRQRVDDPDAVDSMGTPTTEAEFDELMARNRMDLTQALVAYTQGHRETWGFTLLDQPGGGVFVVGFTDDLEGHSARLDEQFPGEPIRVVEAPATDADIAADADRLRDRVVDDDSALVSFGGAGPYLNVGLHDPTRADLDEVAELVDPAHTCTEITWSGLQLPES